MTTLDGLNWKPKWVSHLGCLKGCLDYLNVEVSDAWLFGASGHAFVINIHEVLCPSGPTAWKTERMMELCENVGCDLDVIAGHKSQADFRRIQAEAWSKVRKAIDNRTPCYGWELDIPEFYVIYGHDDAGYLFRGPLCDSGKGPLPWEKLGDTGIGWIQIAIVRPADPPPEKQVVKEALLFATEYAGSPEKWTHDKYKGGLAGYDLWMAALRENKADGFGTAFNAAVWAECRGYATDFLREASRRLDGSVSALFDEAVVHYGEVSANLDKVSETFPFMNVSDEQKKENMKDEKRREASVGSLQAARDAEEKGLAVLQQIVDRL